MARKTRYAIASGFAIAALILAPGAHAAEHVVQPGETLWQIALANGVDADTLLQLNALDNGDVLRAGQTLRLPGRAASTYTVADGDTLSGIAQNLSVSASALIDANKLEDPNRLTVGAQLVVPGGSAEPARAPATATKKSVVTSHTVAAGETLGQIARRLDVSPEAIAAASGLDDPNRISVGTVLKVPLPGAEHVVKEGETLRDIALQAKIDLGLLIDFNDLEDPELIRVGQVVLIPAAGSQRAASAQPAQTQAPRATPTPKPAATLAAAPKPAPPPPTPSANNDGIIANAMKLRGTPYVWGGSSPSGFDCSGFIWYVARQSGKSISRGMMGQYNSGSHPARNELKAGDLVFFQNTYTSGVSHNGVYIGNDQFIHAADEGAGVTVSSLSAQYWASHWFGATRLP